MELAKHAGARVVATVSSAAKAELARAAGADLVLDYNTDDDAGRILESVGRVDRIVEVALGANIDPGRGRRGRQRGNLCLRGGSRGPSDPDSAVATADITIRFVLLYRVSPGERAAAVAWTCAAAEAGALGPLPITDFTPDDVVTAQLAVEGAPSARCSSASDTAGLRDQGAYSEGCRRFSVSVVHG
jgi:NADPH2:quinone reductase